MTPAYSIMSGGSNIRGRVVSIEVTDSEGNDSDQVTIEIDDRNCEVVLPVKGMLLAVGMGYKETGVAPMGIFKITDVRTNGYPRLVKITATSADMGGPLKQSRNDGYEEQSLQDIFGKIAGRNGLAAEVSPKLASRQHKYVAQTAQSDMSFGTDLARQHGARMKISNGRMIVAAAGEMAFGLVTVVGDLAGGADVIDYDAAAIDRPAFGKVAGAWWDRENVEEKKETSGAGSGLAELLHNHHFPNQQEAQDAAEGKGGEKGAEEGGVNLTIVGRPGVRAMMGLTVIGVRPGSADGFWVIKSAKHRIDDSGYTTSIDAGLPNGGQSGGSA